MTNEIRAHRILYKLRDGADWKFTDLHGRVEVSSGKLQEQLDQLVEQSRIVLVSEGVYREAPPAHTVGVGIHCSDTHCGWCKHWDTVGDDVVCLLFGGIRNLGQGIVLLKDDDVLGTLRCQACLDAEIEEKE